MTSTERDELAAIHVTGDVKWLLTNSCFYGLHFSLRNGEEYMKPYLCLVSAITEVVR